MTNSMVFIPVMFLFLIITLATHYKHLLMMLFSLEAMMLIIIMLVPISSCFSSLTSHSSILILLTMGACEASMGLSLMVYISRTFGSDNMSITTLNKC